MNRLAVTLAVLACLHFTPVYAQQDLQPLYDEQVAQVQWRDLSIDFRPVTEKSVRGSQAMVVKSVDQDNGKTYYVAEDVILSLSDISNIDVSYHPNDLNMLRLIMRLDREGKTTLADYSTQHVGEMVGVVIDGQLRLVAHLRQPLTNGKVQVYGFTPQEAVDIAQRYYKPKLELARQIQEHQNKK